MAGRPHPLELEDSLSRLHDVVAPAVAGKVTELTGLVLRATAPGARVGELVRIDRDGRDGRDGRGGEAQGLGDPRRPGPLSRVGDGGLLAEVVGFRGEEVVLLPLGVGAGIGPDSVVRPLGRAFSIPVGPGLLGRVLDAYGEPIDRERDLPAGAAAARVELRSWAVERAAPDPLRRRRITEILPLGVRAIDACLTVGEGQRLGLFSGPGLGKSTLLGQIARQAQADVTVIGLIGERGREVRDFIETQIDAAARPRTVVMCATSDQPPLLRLKAALGATAIAEYFRERGQRVLLLLDSLTRVARAQREVGLAAGELPARQGYPPSVFALLPRLLERSGQGEKGSITAIYTVLVSGAEEDPDDVVADEVRATLDGHIVLSRALAERGRWPAVDVLRSLSRVMDGLRGVSTAHKAAAARLRESLAIGERQRELMLLGAYQRGTDAQVDAALARLPLIEDFLRQRPEEGAAFEETQRRLLELCAG